MNSGEAKAIENKFKQKLLKQESMEKVKQNVLMFWNNLKVVYEFE